MKPILTLGMIAKNEIYGITSSNMTMMSSYKPITDLYQINNMMMLHQSDLPKARSLMLTSWYENARPTDIFMTVDADQIFSPADIFTCIQYLREYDIVCAAYPRKNGNLAVEPENIVEFYRNKKGLLKFGATGMMMMTYAVVKKLVEHLQEKIPCAQEETTYPFYFHRTIEDTKIRGEKNLWLGEDYSFCWLAKTYANAKIFGFVSPTVGHIVTQEKMAVVPTTRKWPDKSIAVYCGKTAEPWSASSLSTGIGGSESAIIRLSKMWVQNGYSVTIFCTCSDPGVYDGVMYTQAGEFSIVDDFDIVVVWRCLQFVNAYQVHARKIFLDLHDVIKDPVTQECVDNLTKFCVKSNFQKKMLPSDVPDNKIIVIPNGGAVQRNKEIKKDENYIIYTSSYDRGLEQILKFGWPKIREKCPNAKLKIFYGWNVFDKMRGGNQKSLEWKQEMVELMKQPGVEEHGRISNQELLKEKEKASIHYYVSDFPEIDCISVRESACLGAIPIVSDSCVFTERDYCVKIKGDPKEEKTQLEAAEKIIEILQNVEYAEKLRSELTPPFSETWENTAQEWIKLFQ